MTSDSSIEQAARAGALALLADAIERVPKIGPRAIYQDELLYALRAAQTVLAHQAPATGGRHEAEDALSDALATFDPDRDGSVAEVVAVLAERGWTVVRHQAPATEGEAAPRVPTFRFTGRATGKDPEGYYYPRWDLAQKVEVIATNRQEATSLAFDMLGIHPRHGRRPSTPGWTLVWDRTEQVSS